MTFALAPKDKAKAKDAETINFLSMNIEKNIAREIPALKINIMILFMSGLDLHIDLVDSLIIEFVL